MIRKRGVLDWTPDPIGEAKRNLQEFTVSSMAIAESQESRDRAWDKMTGAADVNEDGTFRSWHVTDNPFAIEHAFGQEFFDKAGGQLCPGLYLSSRPEMWNGRSRRRWAFLDGLDVDGREILWREVRKIILDHVRTGYLTQREYDHAMDGLDDFLNNGKTYGILVVASQPYNVNVQAVAKKAGIADPLEPYVIEVNFSGRFLDLTSREARDEADYLASIIVGKEPLQLMGDEYCRVLREQGWDGAFTRLDFSTSPELVLWNKNRVISFGRPRG